MAKHLEIPDVTARGQRVLRTLVQAGIPAFLSFALVLPQIIEALGLPVDSQVRLALLAVAAAVTAVAGGLSRVMTIPAVNGWLVRVGLGSITRAEARTPHPADPEQPAADTPPADR